MRNRTTPLPLFRQAKLRQAITSLVKSCAPIAMLQHEQALPSFALPGTLVACLPLAASSTRRSMAATNRLSMNRPKFDEHPVESNCVETIQETLRPPARVDCVRWRLVWNSAQEFFEPVSHAANSVLHVAESSISADVAVCHIRISARLLWDSRTLQHSLVPTFRSLNIFDTLFERQMSSSLFIRR